MKWLIIDTVLCPDSGIAFSLMSSAHNLKFILWYEAEYAIKPGNYLEPAGVGFLINETYREMSIFHVMPGNLPFWRKISKKVRCPGCFNILKRKCQYRDKCILKVCPFAN